MQRLAVQPQMLLIDLDGTLVDTVPDLANAVDVTMQALGLPVRGEASVREWIGNGVERLVRRALINAYDGEPDEALFRRAHPIFLEAYARDVSTYSRPFPGVVEGLDYLSGAGYKLGCVTNKAAAFTEPLLRQLGLYDYFEIVVSGDTLPQKKPHPAWPRRVRSWWGIRSTTSRRPAPPVSRWRASLTATITAWTFATPNPTP
jgi:phosphoglycolate phosphatase